jgi:hypothetical protein
MASRLVALVAAKGAGGVSRRDAMRALKMSRRDMNDLEGTLEERGELRIEKTVGGGPERVRYFAPLSPVSPLSREPFSTNGPGHEATGGAREAPAPEKGLGDNGDTGDSAPARQVIEL